MSQPFLSIIIPAHNEESRLPLALEQLFAFLKKQAYTYDVIVVENGSRDRTLAVGLEYANSIPSLRIIHLDERGKGRAVRCGILESAAEYRFVCDADFSMPVQEINRFLPPLCNCDIAIASREAPGAIRYNEPPFRHFTGRVFNYLIHLMVLPGLGDTQCGFKCFRGMVAEDIFPQQRLNGWSFDVEVLHVARLHGWAIKEIPVPWMYFPGSKVSILRDSMRMFLDLLIIRRNSRLGVYARKA